MTEKIKTQYVLKSLLINNRFLHVKPIGEKLFKDPCIFRS